MKKQQGSHPIRCAIYARTASVKKPDEDNSITQQINKCKRFAKGKAWFVRRNCIFTDSGYSGLTVNSGLRDLMRIAAADPKLFDVLLCTSIDRIARDMDIVIRLRKALNKFGIETHFAGSDNIPA